MNLVKTPSAGGCRLRPAIGPSGLLASLVGLVIFGYPATADAQLVAPYNSQITVDSQYVTGATGATDIAWAPDGRAVVTTKSGDPGNHRLSMSEHAVLSCLEGRARAVAVVVLVSPLRELETLKALRRLVDRGVVGLESAD